MATILYAWELGGGLGHVLRSSPLAETLAAHEHRMIAALRELRRAEAMVARHPHPGLLPSRERAIQFLPAPHLAWKVPDPIEPAMTYADLLHNVGFAQVEDLRILTRAWRTIFELGRPDVVLCDHSPTALFAASLDGIPTATIGTGFCCPPCDGEALPKLRPWMWKQGLASTLAMGGAQQNGELLSREPEQRVLANINAIRAEAGKEPWVRLTQLYSLAAETFLTTFEELDHFAPRNEAQYLGVWKSDQGQPFKWPDGCGPRVFFYTHRFPARDWLLGELRRRGLPTVAYTHDLPKAVVEKIAGPTLFISPVPLNATQAAAECDIAILNSGHNSCAQFLRAGKPPLLLPIALEQGLLMRRLTSQGLAVSAPADHPPAIAAALDELLSNPRYLDAAKAFAAKYASYDAEAALDNIVNRIEQLAQRSSIGKVAGSAN
jgi:hypothetical protein